jgi:prepilin-type N-terminal cleavage/methylation domain-containing protein
MQLTPRTRRQAFTLLEIVLALSIGVLLMTAVYFALDVYLQTTKAGRKQIDQSAVARAVIKRITSDVTVNLATLPPLSPASGSKGGGGGGAAMSTASTTTPAANANTSNMPFVFNLGVQGDQNTLTLYVSKVSRANVMMSTDGTPPPNDQPVDSDLRRITYWLVTDGNKFGLARQEVKMVTSLDEINSLPPDVSDAASMVFAEGVVAATFEYFDGTSWQSSWDGTTVVTNQGGTTPTATSQVQSATGVTPPTPSQPWVGPPLAIKIKLTIGRTDGKDTDPNDPNNMTLVHVIHIPTAIANAQTAPGGNSGGNGGASGGASGGTGNTP